MQKFEDNPLRNIPELIISEREGTNRQEEVNQVLAVPSHAEMRDAWWRFSLGWAKRQQEKLNGTSDYVKTLGSWSTFGLYIELKIDRFRPTEQRYFGDPFHNTTHLKDLNAPDIPPAFASHLCDSMSRPLVALLDYLGWLALERVAYEEISRITIDSDNTTKDDITYRFAKNPPESIKDLVDWEGNEVASRSIERIMERDFANYQRFLNIENEKLTQEMKDDGVTVLDAVFEELERSSKTPLAEILNNAQDERVAKLLSITTKHRRTDAARKRIKQEFREPALAGFENEEGDSTWVLDKASYAQWFSNRYTNPIYLDNLRLPLDRLTPTEQRIFNEVRTALSNGYEFDSKTGLSFRSLWGKDYSKNIKAWQRVKAKLNEANI